VGDRDVFDQFINGAPLREGCHKLTRSLSPRHHRQCGDLVSSKHYRGIPRAARKLVDHSRDLTEQHPFPVRSPEYLRSEKYFATDPASEDCENRDEALPLEEHEGGFLK